MKYTDILVVEDEAVVAMDIERRLLSLGYQVTESVGTAEEAIEKSRKVQPKLVLMDIRLKGEVDGIDAAQKIRSEMSVPIVFLTSYSDELTLERAKKVEPLGYIMKPFEERELRAVIEIALYKHQAETKLRQMEYWLAATMNSIGDAVIALDLNGKVRYLNPEAERLTGWKSADATGLDSTDVFRVFMGDFPMPSPLRKTLEEGVVFELSDNVELVHGNGRRLWIEHSVAPIRNSHDRITGAVIVFRDITEKKNNREQLHHLQKLGAIGRLAGGIAHDFNNLLTVILGYASSYQEQLPKESPVREGLRIIRTAAQRAAELTHQLLAFDRKQVLKPEPLDLNQTVLNMQNLLERVIDEDIELHVQTGNEVGVVRMDGMQLEQVLLNLATNARDAMPSGGKLTIRTAGLEIKESIEIFGELAQPGKYSLLEISDTGVGMDGDTLSHVFEPFYTTKPTGKGTGLGLAMVYGIVRQSGGYITVLSEPGKGSVFQIYLPAVTDKPAPPREPYSVEITKGHGTIMVIEDEKPVRDLVQMILEEAGYQVIALGDEEEADRLLQIESVDLIVSDVVMPKISGPEFVECLRKRCPKEPRVIFMSGYSEAVVAKKGRFPEGAAFIRKPFEPDQLLALVARIIKQPQA